MTAIRKDYHLLIYMTRADRELLDRLRHRHRTSRAAVVRQLIWKEAEKEGIPLPEIAQEDLPALTQ